MQVYSKESYTKYAMLIEDGTESLLHIVMLGLRAGQ